ncbi:MAG TPA: NAD(P)H:quinone oxidoreductase [Longimicrobiales bacterium]|nr:NAD(P)H:quinone oxidoreductase [Longimicrobiales bacterium]
MTRVLVVYYSSYGHTHEMAKAVADGAKSVAGTEVLLRRVPELADARRAMSTQEAYVRAQEAQQDVPEVTLDDLRSADGVAWGTPTRYGNMAAQLKQFIDTTGELWQQGALEDRATGVFTSTATTHGGSETTILTTMVTLLHLGMVLCGSPYGQNPAIMTDEGVGGSPYGPSTIAGPDGSRTPVDDELETARNLGSRIARVAAALKVMRESGEEDVTKLLRRGRAA